MVITMMQHTALCTTRLLYILGVRNLPVISGNIRTTVHTLVQAKYIASLAIYIF